MKTLLLCALALVACKSPGECDVATQPCTHYGVWAGPPMGGSIPDDGKGTEVFFEFPDCEGQGYIAGYGEEFAYESIRIGASCFAESGRGYGFVVL